MFFFTYSADSSIASSFTFSKSASCTLLSCLACLLSWARNSAMILSLSTEAAKPLNWSRSTVTSVCYLIIAKGCPLVDVADFSSKYLLFLSVSDNLSMEMPIDFVLSRLFLTCLEFGRVYRNWPCFLSFFALWISYCSWFGCIVLL